MGMHTDVYNTPVGIGGTCLVLNVEVGDLNSGSHAYTGSTLMTEPFPKLHSILKLVKQLLILFHFSFIQ